MLSVLEGWVGDRRVEVAADCAYCCKPVACLPSTFIFFGAMRPDAVLTAQPEEKPRPGRPSKRGVPLPKPEKVAKNSRIPWQTCVAFLYGEKTRVRYKTFCAQWYRVRLTLAAHRVTECTTGAIPFRVFSLHRLHAHRLGPGSEGRG